MDKTEQVKAYLMDLIAKNKIQKGQRFPGCREIAEKLSINKITANKAFHLLEEEHILYCIPRGGYYFVGSDVNEETAPKIFDFSTMNPDPALIPYRTFTHAMNRAIEEHKKLLFEYEKPLGLEDLRNTLKERFESDGIYTSSSQIMITNGSQQGIYLIFKSLFPQPCDKKLLIEVPTYNQAMDIAKSLNINLVGIRRDEQGINITELKTLFQKKDINAFYIIPRHHNPTGYSLSEKNKKQIVELCQRYHVLLIEDDFLAELNHEKRSLPLHYYDTNHITFYIRSFSKTFMPGIRLGSLVIPDHYLTTIINMKHLMDINTSSIPQSALDFFIKSGMYDQHIKKVNTCYRRKLQKAESLLKSICPADIIFHVPKQGFFVWLILPSFISSDHIICELAKRNVRICSNSKFYLNAQTENTLRLCISSIKEKDIPVLGDVIDEINKESHRNR